MDDESKEFQKSIAGTQIWSNALITLGGVSFGSGVSMWITVWTLIGTASTLENESPFLFKSSRSLSKIRSSFLYFWNCGNSHRISNSNVSTLAKIKKNKEPNTCYC